MNGRKIGMILGKIMVLEGILMIAPLTVSLICQESDVHIFAFYIPAVMLIIAGIFLQQLRPTRSRFDQKEVFISIGLLWITTVLFGAIPLVISGEISNYIDACFEVMPLFARRSSRVMHDVSLISRSALFWRNLSKWMGGLGIMVFVFPKCRCLLLSNVIGNRG